MCTTSASGARHPTGERPRNGTGTPSSPDVRTEEEPPANLPAAHQAPDASSYVTLVAPRAPRSLNRQAGVPIPAAEVPLDWAPCGSAAAESSGPFALGELPPARVVAPIQPLVAAPCLAPFDSATPAPSSKAGGNLKRPVQDASVGGHMPSSKRPKCAPPTSAVIHTISDDDWREDVGTAEGVRHDTPLQDAVPEAIVEDGDVVLVVGPRRRRFLVCSRVLLRASPVLGNAYRDDRESPARSSSGGTALRKITIPDVDDSAAHVVVGLVHSGALATQAIHKYTLNWHLLINMLLVAERFDLLCVMPTVCRLASSLFGEKAPLLKAYRVPADELAQMLWVSYRVGSVSRVKEVMGHLVCSAGITPDGELRASNATRETLNRTSVRIIRKSLAPFYPLECQLICPFQQQSSAPAVPS